MKGGNILISNKEGKQFSVYMIIILTLFLASIFYYWDQSFIAVLYLFVSVIFYLFFFYYKDIRVVGDEMYIFYQFRPVFRYKKININEIKKLRVDLGKVYNSYRYVHLHQKSNFFFFEFRLIGVRELDNFLSFLNSKGVVLLKTEKKRWDVYHRAR